MRHGHTTWYTIATFLIALATTTASAQVRPFDLFLDLDSAGNTISLSQCDLINAGNARLVVLTDTAQLVIIDGFDVVLADTAVAANGDVFFEGDQAGFIAFHDDGNDLRTLWWVSLNGFVVDVDGFSGRPTVTTRTPQEFTDVDCDACDFWDVAGDCTECSTDSECDDGNDCTIDSCSSGVCAHFDALLICDDGDACTVGDICLSGECVGTAIDDCEPDDDNPTIPPIRITFCGNGTAMIFPVVLMMLGFAKLGLISRRNGRRTIARK